MPVSGVPLLGPWLHLLPIASDETVTPRNLSQLQTCGLPRPTAAAAAALGAASRLEQSRLPSHHPGLWEGLSLPVFRVTLSEVPPPDSHTPFAVQLLALVAMPRVELTWLKPDIP